MKKILFTLCLWLTVCWLFAQQKKSHPQLFTGNLAIQEKSLEQDEDTPAPHIYLQIGNPIHYFYHTSDTGSVLTGRFLWDVPYIPLTFDEAYFDVSKGYFSEKILLNWTIQANSSKINQIKIYRRIFQGADLNDIDNYVLIATLPSDSYSYEDTNTQGGVLYEYKVEAAGVSSISKKYVTYITGVGYRNPTGVITGNVSFDGGSPVRDVVVRADPQGTDLTFGSSLHFSDIGSLAIPFKDKQLNNNITLQAWVKLEANSVGSLFMLSDRHRTTDEINVSYATTDNHLEITVAHTAGISKTFSISNFYPNGNVDGRGDDLFNAFTDADHPTTNFDQNFIHLSIVLKNGTAPLFYLNGRNINEDYLTELPSDAASVPAITTSGDFIFTGFETADMIVAKALTGNIDEIRLWNIALDEKRIRTDFKRYLGGSEANLVSYLRCDEKAGEFAYDISRIGFEFNKNHARIIKGSWSSDKPSPSQLGIMGVTDALGNYIISAIPYSGTGESYTITPMLGVHQFEPSQQLVFIGNGSEVINKIDFKDVSAFDFMGVVYYATNGVFEPIEQVDNVTSVIEAGYNQYSAIINGNEQLISKGTYYYDENDVLWETPKVFVPNANIYIDGEIVLDKDKRPAVTDQNGFFKIKVPIGEHYIEVRKDKHGFAHAGRFPAAREDGDDLFEFFEHQQSAVTFIDTTRVTLVGRIVGGTREAEKPIGFGFAGSVQETYKPGTDEEETKHISSINNIGKATVKLQYLPFGGTPGQELEYTFTTNEETGEYRVSLLPLSYTIPQVNGIRINSNPGIQLLNANEPVNASEAQDTTTSSFTNANGDIVRSEPYHFVKSFTYRSTPVLNVVSQSSDTEVMVKIPDNNGIPQETSISTDGFDYPVYTQGLSYGILFETFEEYVNYDGSEEVTDQVPIVDGEFNITNNLALSGSENLTVDPDKPSLSKYSFRAGLPSIAPPFVRTIDIKYRVDGRDYDARNYKTEGIILGGQSDGSQTFVTEAPDIPDIILRDPPGSNSFASIEKGTSLTITEEGNFEIGQTQSYELEMKLGVKFAAGGGLAGPVVETETVNDLTAGISLAVESTHGKSITKTYTFNQTISTSDDPLYVGSKGDLYIGNTKNYFYGSYDNVQVSKSQLGTAPSLELTNKEGISIHVSKQKAFYFAEEPSETFFIFSQHYILETLIPELQSIIQGIDLGTISENTPGVLKKSQYEEQVRLWKKVIQDNERTKYLALHDRTNYKTQIKSNIEKEIDALNDHITAIQVLSGGTFVSPTLSLIGVQSLAEAGTLLRDKKDTEEKKLQLLENEFLKNISFDAGVGSYTKSSGIVIAQKKTRNVKFDIDPSFEHVFGFDINETGMEMTSSGQLHTSVNSALEEEEEESTTVTYTLKDNDLNNFLSVDVINTFDGNGPIFSTIGGRTSCPYEGVDLTKFYNHSQYNSDPSKGISGLIYGGGEQIAFATQKIEVPDISVAVASVTDVPEERAAEFKLILENNNAVGANAYMMLYVDNTTNPNNAIINLDPNGTVVYVPYGQKTEYVLTLKKSISDVYEYKDIAIYLGSICDALTNYDHVTLSAVFRPSCTAVKIDNPLENWVFNAGDAYNLDNTTNPLNIAVFGYNRSFTGFENYRLEYRKATSSSWTRLRSYYNTQALLDEAIVQGEDMGTLIDANTTNFLWDIGALGLADGQYELRAVSSCSNGTIFISDVVKGTVDLNVPVQFGTPTPTDGILGPGEDLRLQFSEDILYSSAISKIQIQGETNQQDIAHDVSVHFEGPQNTVAIEKPNIFPGDFSMEFWMLNITSGSAVLFHQSNAFRVVINNGVMQWTLGNETISQSIAEDGAFHHYTLTYNAANKTLKIFQDDHELGETPNANGLQARSDEPLIIGGNTFIGNLHDLRFWTKPLTLSEAYAGQFKQLIGSERHLVGYWPMSEGAGDFCTDRARFKHAVLNAAWDIKPKGTAYNFTGNHYLELDDVNFVQLTNLMDVTLSFWVKTAQTQKATIFSNGRGNGEDLIQSNGKANKWAVSIENGILYLNNEGNQHKLTTSSIADDTWHHVAVVLRRNGSLKTYIDAAQVSSSPVTGIGGLSGNKFWIGARGFINSALQETVDEIFTGKIDELRLWNTARATEQISRDRYNEVPFNALGLMLYARMNQPDPVTGNGPQYYHVAQNETVLPSNAVMNSGPVSYTMDAPKIKQVRPYLTFEVSHVINKDEMIITPLISDWSVLEGQILDITVDRMFDIHGNRQASPITWTAYVRRNEVAWFTDDNQQILNLVKPAGEPYSFKVTLLNKGGKKQPYSIENVPAWLKASNTTGILDPNSSRHITFNIAPELTIGEYTQDLYLNTDFNFDEKILLNLRVLGEAPAWTVDPSAYEYSMNIIGKIKINGIISSDSHVKIAAFSGEEIRGVSNLEYDENYDEYFVYLNIFSNTSSGDEITFKIWDAATGKVYQATMNGVFSLAFIQNEVIGMKSAPVIFENTAYIEQNLQLNAGWTWISLYAEDEKLNDLNSLTSSLNLSDNDLVKNQLYFDVYDRSHGWTGTLSNNGGLTTSSMYKVRLTNKNLLVVGGDEIDVSAWKADINIGWNWLAYPMSNNVSINEALAFLEANEGDVIKNQRSFAIYDPVIGWSGTLRYLFAGEGYMLKSGVAQEFRYPNIFSTAKSGRLKQDTHPVVEGWQHYEHNMNVVAEVIAEEHYDSILVTDKNGTIRGKSSIVERNGRQFSYLTVFGNSQGEETFYFSLANTNGNAPTNRNFNFIPDMVMGTIKEPVKLMLSNENGIAVYPNVFSNEVNLQFNAQHEQDIEIALIDMVGHIAYMTPALARKGHNHIEVQPNVPDGLYLLSIAVDGQKRTFKVIKK